MRTHLPKCPVIHFVSIDRLNELACTNHSEQEKCRPCISRTDCPSHPLDIQAISENASAHDLAQVVEGTVQRSGSDVEASAVDGVELVGVEPVLTEQYQQVGGSYTVLGTRLTDVKNIGNRRSTYGSMRRVVYSPSSSDFQVGFLIKMTREESGLITSLEFTWKARSAGV